MTENEALDRLLFPFGEHEKDRRTDPGNAWRRFVGNRNDCTVYGDYNAVVAQGEEEIRRGFMPEIRPFGARTADYDTVILGTPVWWYTFAPAVKTFLAGNDLAGKTVYPFATKAVDGTRLMTQKKPVRTRL